MPACSYREPVSNIIAHLNDVYKWSREAIADWVALFETAVSESVQHRSTLRAMAPSASVKRGRNMRTPLKANRSVSGDSAFNRRFWSRA